MKKILFAIGLSLLLSPSFNDTHASDVNRFKDKFFGLHQASEDKKDFKPIHKKKAWIKPLIAFLSIGVTVISVSMYMWYASSSVDEEYEEEPFQGNVSGKYTSRPLGKYQYGEGSSTANSLQGVSESRDIYSKILTKGKIGECPSCFNSVRIFPFCSTKHPYCAFCSYKWTMEYKTCPTCRVLFKEEALALIKNLNQCVQIEYENRLVWVNKDFVWFNETELTEFPEDQDDYKCGVCKKIQNEAITFLLCACGKNPLCIACWKEKGCDRFGYECPNCEDHVSKSDIDFGQKCLNDLLGNDTHPILKVQNALKQGNVDFDDIKDRSDSIQTWVEKYSSNRNTMNDGE